MWVINEKQVKKQVSRTLLIVKVQVWDEKGKIIQQGIKEEEFKYKFKEELRISLIQKDEGRKEKIGHVEIVASYKNICGR